MPSRLFIPALLVALGATATSCSPRRAGSRQPAASPAAAFAESKTGDIPPLLNEEQQEAKAEALARFAAGLSRDLKQEPDKAAEEFYLSALADPANEPLVLEVARQMLREGKQAEKVITLLARSAEAPGASASVDGLLAIAYSQAGQKEQAVAACRKAIVKSPAAIQGYQTLFQIHLRAEQPAEALAILAEAGQVKTEEPAFYIGLAELLQGYSQGKPGELEKNKPRIRAALESARALPVPDLGLAERMAQAYQAIGEFKEAAALYLGLLGKHAGSPEITAGLRGRLAELYLRSGDKQEAAAQLESILRDDPANPQAHFFLGTLAYDAKEFSQAAERFEKAIQLNANFEPVYFELAGVRLAQKKPALALAVLDQARARFRRSFLLEFYSALASNAKKDYPGAVRYLTDAEAVAKATEPDRLNANFYFQLGAAHERNKDLVQAEKYFRECLRQSPDFSEALNYLGYMWAEHGANLAEARAMIEKALKLEPDNGAFLDSMGWVLFKQGLAKEALPFVLKSLEKAEEPDPTLLDHLGDIYAALHRPAEARAAWQKSLALEANSEIQKKLGAMTLP